MVGTQEEEVVTSGFKWLRAVAHAEFTGLHTDRVFLGRGVDPCPQAKDAC